MSFTSYASANDLEAYVPGSVQGLWSDDKPKADDSLARASREVNEWLGGLDRISEIPIEVDDDDRYPEVVIKLTVYTAVYNQVAGTHAGEIFEDHWRWLIQIIRDIKASIEKGRYRFSSDPSSVSSGSSVIEIGRASP